METVEIPTTVILEAMLTKLGLPCPKYENGSIGGDFFQAGVLFYPSAQLLHSGLSPHKLYGSPALSLEAAANAAADSAISYMATDEMKVLKDYNYDKLKKQERKNKRFRCRLEKESAKLTERTNQLVKAIRTSDVLIDKISDSTNCIRKIASENLSASCSTMAADLHAVATALTQHTVDAVATFKAIGAYPLDEECPRDDSRQNFSDSDEERFWKCEALDWDSDGRHIDDIE